MFKTGDLAKYTNDNNIICLGRLDDQIKIRGFRIELCEIEQTIIHFNKEILKVNVIDRYDEYDNKFLCAFYKSNDDIDFIELKLKLSTKLPQYMIPNIF